MQASSEDVSVSEIFRNALDEYLSKKTKSKKKQNPFAKVSSKISTPKDWQKIKPEDLSKSIDGEIYG